MTEKLREAAQAALEALCTCTPQQREASKQLRAALAEQDAEPVAWTRKQMGCDREYCETPFTTDWTPLYTAPPRREWVSLTDEERAKIAAAQYGLDPWKTVYAVEAALKEKNS